MTVEEKNRVKEMEGYIRMKGCVYSLGGKAREVQSVICTISSTSSPRPCE